jgi:hypothetical protein
MRAEGTRQAAAGLFFKMEKALSQILSDDRKEKKLYKRFFTGCSPSWATTPTLPPQL